MEAKSFRDALIQANVRNVDGITQGLLNAIGNVLKNDEVTQSLRDGVMHAVQTQIFVPGSELESAVQAYVQKQVQRLEEEARSPKDSALEHLRRFSEQETFKIGGDAKVRLAPDMIAKLYKNGRTATRELEEFLRSKGLEKCHAAQELPTLGLVVDRLVAQDSKADIINLSAVEVLCRKIYGLLRAFEDVKCEADWKQPKGSGSGK